MIQTLVTQLTIGKILAPPTLHPRDLNTPLAYSTGYWRLLPKLLLRQHLETCQEKSDLPLPAVAHLVRWIVTRGDEPGPLLYPISKSGRVVTRRLSDQAVLTCMRSQATDAGVVAFTPHDFRRTFISDLLDAGVDIVTDAVGEVKKCLFWVIQFGNKEL